MRKIYFVSIIVLTFILIGCNNDSPTSSNSSKTSSGKISLKIDKANAPQDVAGVVAYLSRTGFDTLKSSTNFLSDTSAELYFSNIAVGLWKLKVNALDNNNVILYTGETDVNVEADVITQVTMTLLPAASGTGGISIHVGWGTNTIWTDYNLNPVLTTEMNPSSPVRVLMQKVMYDENKYKMWYASSSNSSKINCMVC